MKRKYLRKKSNLNLIILIVLICFISLSYAVFSQELEINGNIVGNATFNVYFMDAWVEESSKGTAIINTLQGADTVKYTVNLSFPGDKVLIGTKIKNDSSFPVKLNDFTPTNISNNSEIKFEYITLDTNNEILQPGAICDYRFIAYWKENSQNTNPERVAFDIQLNYEQYTDMEISQEPIRSSHGHWLQDGTTVTNGTVTFEVGSSITGYKANGISNWYVLGAKCGELLITTNMNVENVTLSGKTNYTNGIEI